MNAMTDPWQRWRPCATSCIAFNFPRRRRNAISRSPLNANWPRPETKLVLLSLIFLKCLAFQWFTTSHPPVEAVQEQYTNELEVIPPFMCLFSFFV